MLIPLYTLVLASTVSAALYSVNVSQLALSRDLQDEARLAAVSTLTAAIRDFFELQGRFPNDLTELAATPMAPGFDDYAIQDITYAHATGLNNGTYGYDRAALFTTRPQFGGAENLARDITPAERLLSAENNCDQDPGDVDFDAAIEFCFPEAEVVSWVGDTRSQILENSLSIRRALRATLDDFAYALSSSGAVARPQGQAGQFPQRYDDGADAALPVDTVISLAALVGYAGTADNCQGPFQFVSTVLDCEDIFSPVNGNPVFYSYSGPLLMTLFVDSGLLDGGGNPIFFGQELNVPVV